MFIQPYFSYVHSVLSYGIIFWGNSFYSKSILKIQIRIIWVVMSSGRRDSCHELFRELNILPLHPQYIFSLLLFIFKNGDRFLFNEVRDINTRYNSDLRLPLENLTLYQKGAVLREVGFVTTCCQLSRTFQIMGNV